MNRVVYVPCDSSAVSLGADTVAEAIRREASGRKLDVKIVRNGSRGMFSYEPMVEVATSAERIAYGPVATADVASLFGCISASPTQYPGSSRKPG
jgi:formate dehydrogenase iron-sulfur subunit